MPENKRKEDNPAGLTSLDTGVCYFSLLYPLIRDSSDNRLVYIFQEKERERTSLDKIRYYDLQGKYRRELRNAEKKRAASFYILCAALIVTMLFFLNAFKIILAVSMVVTFYEYVDRRIKSLWLKREYKRNN